MYMHTWDDIVSNIWHFGGEMQLADMDTGTYTKEASCILSNLRNRVMRLFCQIPSIDIALINLLKSCMAYIYIHISSAD